MKSVPGKKVSQVKELLKGGGKKRIWEEKEERWVEGKGGGKSWVLGP